MRAKESYWALLRLVDTRAAGPRFPDMLDAADLRRERLAEFGLVAPSAAELVELGALRDALVSVVLDSALNTPTRVAALNSIVRDYGLVPQLDDALELGWATSGQGRVAALAEQVLPQALDLFRSNDVAKVQLCAADDCAAPFVASSTPGSRSFCSARCSTRVRVRRHRASRADGSGRAK